MVDPRRRCVRCSPRRSPLVGLLDHVGSDHHGGRSRRAPDHCNGGCHSSSASHPSVGRRCAGRSRSSRLRRPADVPPASIPTCRRWVVGGRG